MAEHETVSCPRCNKAFECRVGSILRCQCQEVTLNEEERIYIAEHYAGCLCASCMQVMKEQYRLEQLQKR
ncbi:cysteine-rich CWC family protein [Chitinophaga sancti]|uniref:Cysteine-rich CWC family protein n=1 Tax=Chitinophaga sancti TaxID=1004 RepID=A0ABZ0XF44_9BACT|nr:cysteine-rich CWC family protein [Chitinophaga sancti]WQD65133.1 cysteine-rich CWC family protein [Chitinophaga sancti]WQG89243.1 cysteine-rich CWC family protein [Chitinophaga sancti]